MNKKKSADWIVFALNPPKRKPYFLLAYNKRIKKNRIEQNTLVKFIRKEYEWTLNTT